MLTQALRSLLLSYHSTDLDPPHLSSERLALLGVNNEKKMQPMNTTEYNSIVGVIPKEGLGGLVPAKLPFGMTTTRIYTSVLA